MDKRLKLFILAILLLSQIPASVLAAEALSLTARYGSEAGFQDGALGEARFQSPQGATAYDAKTLFVADTGNHCIRLVDFEAERVTTLYGECTKSGDGERLDTPVDLEFCRHASTLYVADSGNERVLAFFVEPTGAGGVALEKTKEIEIVGLGGIACDKGEGAFFAASRKTHEILRYFDEAQGFETMAGTGKAGYDPNERDALKSRTHAPTDVLPIYYSSDNFALYFTDSKNGFVRWLLKGDTIAWRIANIIGVDDPSFADDSLALAQRTLLWRPYRLARFQKDGNELLLVVLPLMGKILAMTPERKISALVKAEQACKIQTAASLFGRLLVFCGNGEILEYR